MLSTLTLNIVASCRNGSCLDLSSPGLINFGKFDVSDAIIYQNYSFALVYNYFKDFQVVISSATKCLYGEWKIYGMYTGNNTSVKLLTNLL